MTIIIAAVSIITIAAVAWFANRFLPFTVCPMCAGVFTTWAWLVGAHIAGYEVAMTVPAILMGGSVVGIAYQLEKKFGGPPSDGRMFWKTLFATAGFIAAYAVLEQSWTVLLFAVAFMVVISLPFLSTKVVVAIKREEAAAKIERDMKDCC